MKGIYRGLKLTDQILKIVDRVTEKLMRKQVYNDEMHFGFIQECRNTEPKFILQQLLEKYLATKKNLHSTFADLGKLIKCLQILYGVLWGN